MDIDEDINRNNLQSYYRDTSVYIIHYEKGKKTKFSNGLIKSIKEDDSIINHICQTEHGSSGSPIINLDNYKVIGIHRGFKKGDEWNIGIMLTSPINDFMSELLKEKEINIILNKKYLFRKAVKVIDSLFSLRKILGEDIKDDFIFANHGKKVDIIDEKNIIIKKILKNNKDIEICYKLLINKYSNTNPESNHELIYQYYYDKFNSDDYKNAYVIIFVGKNNQGKTKTLNSLLNIIKGISLDNKKRFTLTDLVGEYRECSSTEGFHIYYLKDYSGNPIILIDTPGFCNSSKGIKNDEKINELFYYIFSNIIEHINLICFITKNHNRLTREELYCFCNIMNLFTKDIKDNFISLITFENSEIMEKEDYFFTKHIIKYLEIEDKLNKNNLYCFNNRYIFQNIISKDTELSYNQLYKFYHEKVKNSKYLSTKYFVNFIDYRINLNNKIKYLEQAFFEYFRNKNSNNYQGKIRYLISEIKNLIKSINEKSIYLDYIKIVKYFEDYIDNYLRNYCENIKPRERDLIIIKNKKKIIKFIENINSINNENILSFSIEELMNKIAK